MFLRLPIAWRIAAGFAVEKVPGYGTKREMLRGHFVSAARQIAVRMNRLYKW